MIRTHAFNTRWYGAPVGIVEDASLFALPADARAALLRGYAWVELRARAGVEVPHGALRASGFAWCDTQLRFRIDLRAVAQARRGDDGLRVCSAAEAPFTVAADALATFSHERFARLPGMTDARLAARYERWAAALLDESPDTCLRATLDDGRTVGWFLAAPRGESLELTLAALHRDASVSGARLYEACLATFAARGHRLGHASFSAENTSVLNVYASLGARFVAPEHIWLWTADSI